jgi:CO/xanthine dehydrogenase FAD-binding subunit
MALLNVKEILRPTSLEEALVALKKHGEKARLLAGGIELVLFTPADVETLIDLSCLSLSYVKEGDGGLTVGATTTMTEVLEARVMRDYLDGVVVNMLQNVASPLLRNLATMGGTLVSANPWSDVITLFLALDAKVKLYSGKTRTVALSEIYPTRTHLSQEILIEVILPKYPSGTYAAFHQFSRTSFDVALLNCACWVQIEGGICAKARIMVGGTPRLATSIPKAEKALIGAPLTGETVEHVANMARDGTETRDDRRASAAYRKELVLVGIKRCLAEIKGRLEKGRT